MISHTRSNADKTRKLPFDTVIIRFTRQIFYDQEDCFQLEVRQTPSPLAGGAFRTNVEAQLDDFRKIFSQQIRQSHFYSRFEIPGAELTSAEDLADLGYHLEVLLPDAFRQDLRHLVQTVFEKGRGLCFIFEARAGDQADRLLNLPWEILLFKETGVYLGRSPRVLIIRRLLDAARRSPVQMAPPLNITHVIAHSPVDQEAYPVDESLRRVERDTIPQAVAPGLYRLVDPPGSVEQMLSALREHPYHIVHFLGHGEIYTDEKSQGTVPARGYLHFTSQEGQTQWVTGEQLQHLLSFTPTVQLVVLNACYGSADVTGNIALELVYNGLPYVVGMQAAILQEAARFFIAAFYEALQQGDSIEYAVAAGRAAIAANLPGTIDWCLPILYTNLGLPDPSSAAKVSGHLWQWVSLPGALKWFGVGNLILGGLHTLVGLLLILSQVTIAPPDFLLLDWAAGAMATIPLLLTMVAFLSGRLKMPEQWLRATQATFLVRSLGAAAIGIGLPAFYTWIVLLLLLSIGFWNLLSFWAQLILIVVIFSPNLLIAYSQIVGQGRAFITNANIEQPDFQWGELVLVLGGYLMLLLPWLGLRWGADLAAPPWGNLIAGLFLGTLGWALYRDGVKDG